MPDIPAPSFAPRFACTGCGKCCTGGSRYVVEVSRAEQRRIQKHLGVSWAWFRRKYLFRFDDETESLRMPKGRCVFLDADNRCRVYQARPLQCRTYPWWPELMNRRAWRLEARRCEGIGRGSVVPLAQVRRQLARQAQ
jgi:Fe-S-cluster containining protein